MNRYLIDFITKQWKPDEDFEVFTAENGTEDKRPHARPSRPDYESSQNRRYGTGAVDYGYADTVSRLRITLHFIRFVEVRSR